MHNKWFPSKEQNEGVVSRAVDFILDELNELQEELDCPDEFICSLLGTISDKWFTESCHDSLSELKKKNLSQF